MNWACRGSAALCGVSSGAALVLEAAASGLPVSKVAVYEPSFALYEGGVKERAEYTERLTELLARGRRGDAVELFIALTGACASGGDREHAAVPHVGGHGGGRTDPRVRQRRHGRRTGTPRAAGLRHCAGTRPRGRHEPRVDARGLPGGRGRTPNGTYRVLDDQGHMVDPQAPAPVPAEFFGA